MENYNKNINKDCINNECYRKIIYTGKLQIILQSLNPGETVELEKHIGIDQFIRCEYGKGVVIINGNSYLLKNDDAIVIPAGSEHFIYNSSRKKKFKFCTIYSKPEHSEDQNLC